MGKNINIDTSSLSITCIRNIKLAPGLLGLHSETVKREEDRGGDGRRGAKKLIN